jgi:hypothetical protein
MHLKDYLIRTETGKELLRLCMLRLIECLGVLLSIATEFAWS